MADDILSQEEVDALLRGVSGEPEEGPAVEEKGGVKTYDMGRQERIVRGRMPTLELINERFARLLRIGLFSFVRRSAEISVNPVRVVKYSEFVRNLVVPTNLNLVQVKPLRGSALIVFDPNLVFQVIDNLFGGDGQKHTRVEGRDFTLTEQRIIQRMLSVVFEEYEKSWKSVFEIKFEYVRSEMHTQFVNIATPSEVVVATSFNVDLGHGGGEIHLCMPYAMLEPIRDIIYSSIQTDRNENDDRWVSLLRNQIQDAEVEMVAHLGDAPVTLRQIMNLAIGDIVTLNIPESITAGVDGIPVLEGKYGVSNNHYALKVERVLNANEAVALGGRHG
jgi:flagellar motor switch protein FliM